MCYKCGDIGLGEFVDQSMCQIPAAGQNTTEGFAELEECTEGACYVSISVKLGQCLYFFMFKSLLFMALLQCFML